LINCKQTYDIPPLSRERHGLPGHTYPFISRLTRAYLNFEVKGAPKARGLRPSVILEFKIRIRFSAAMR